MPIHDNHVVFIYIYYLYLYLTGGHPLTLLSPHDGDSQWLNPRFALSRSCLGHTTLLQIPGHVIALKFPLQNQKMKREAATTNPQLSRCVHKHCKRLSSSVRTALALTNLLSTRKHSITRSWVHVVRM